MSARDNNTRLAYVRGLAEGFSRAGVPGSVSDARLRALLEFYGNHLGGSRGPIPKNERSGDNPTPIWLAEDISVVIGDETYIAPAGWWVTNGHYALALDAAVPEDHFYPVENSVLASVLKASGADEVVDASDPRIFVAREYTMLLEAFPFLSLWRALKPPANAEWRGTSAFYLLDPTDTRFIKGLLMGMTVDAANMNEDRFKVRAAGIVYDPKQTRLRKLQGRLAAAGRRVEKQQAVRAAAETGSTEGLMALLLTAKRDRIPESYVVKGVSIEGGPRHDWLSNGYALFRLDWLTKQKVRLIGNFTRREYNPSDLQPDTVAEVVQRFARARRNTDFGLVSLRYLDAVQKAASVETRGDSPPGLNPFLLYDENGDVVGAIMPFRPDLQSGEGVGVTDRGTIAIGTGRVDKTGRFLGVEPSTDYNIYKAVSDWVVAVNATKKGQKGPA